MVCHVKFSMQCPTPSTVKRMEPIKKQTAASFSYKRGVFEPTPRPSSSIKWKRAKQRVLSRTQYPTHSPSSQYTRASNHQHWGRKDRQRQASGVSGHGQVGSVCARVPERVLNLEVRPTRFEIINNKKAFLDPTPD